jgi:ABC-type dipeptide/oligopeptide/nickel transport system ATPase component
MEKLLEIKNLEINFKDKQAVKGINLDINKGEIVGLVGESGCGKSVTSMSIMGLLNGNNISGEIVFDGKDILSLKGKELRTIRGNDISMIFQNTMSSLNPTMKIGKQISEVLKIHSNKSKKEIKEEVLRTLEKVELKNVEEIYNSYPHQLSGGMRQRVMIAMAIINKPKLIIADEPTTALDVIIQKQILDLLKSISQEYNTSILFISHDLSVVSNICDRINVMYDGEIVETGTTEDIFYNTKHDYTKQLINAIPQIKK